jgi:hypothetical protein
LLHPNAAQDTIWNFKLFHPRGCLFWFANHGFVMQISHRYQSTDLEMDDWRIWRHEWFILVTALKICIISRSAKRTIKGVFIPLYVSLITWKWKSNYFYIILEVFHKFLWKIKNRVICPLRIDLNLCSVHEEITSIRLYTLCNPCSSLRKGVYSLIVVLSNEPNK